MNSIEEVKIAVLDFIDKNRLPGEKIEVNTRVLAGTTVWTFDVWTTFQKSTFRQSYVCHSLVSSELGAWRSLLKHISMSPHEIMVQQAKHAAWIENLNSGKADLNGEFYPSKEQILNKLKDS